MIVNEQIVKVTGNRAGHNYRINTFYKVSNVPPRESKYLKLLEIIKIPGAPAFTGNNIYPSDCTFIDVFAGDEEFETFIKEKERLILSQLITTLKIATCLKGEIKQATEFSSKEAYTLHCITKCKAELTDDEDEDCKQIVTLLASLT